MSGMLDSGTRLTADSGLGVEASTCSAPAAREVYRVRTAAGDQALKWYYPACATREQEDIVRQLVDRGFDDDRFLWPRDFVGDGRGGFGYLMDIRPDRFKGLPLLFRRKLRTTVRALLTACLYTVEAYQALHSRGIAYRDISWGNLLFDPTTGEVLVCDNDNAVVEGDSTGISGTMAFMAPELVRGEPGVSPARRAICTPCRCCCSCC